MQINTKKYGGDAIKSYKVLMRKISRDGLYRELREKEFFVSKGEKRRKNKELGKLRTLKRLKLKQEEQAKKQAKSNKQKY
jgi:ribosomal protein S21